MLHKIQFAPGINKESTQYATNASWWDCDKVRFREGRPEQIGGWEKYSETSYLGVCRSLFDWTTSGSYKYLGMGTNLKFYIEDGGSFVDVTPIRATTGVGDPTFAAVNGDATITVTEAGHGCARGDYVTFSDAVSLGGNISADILNQEYEVATLIDSDNFTIEAKDNTTGDPVLANASDTGDGSPNTVAAYQISTGTNAYIASVGYSAGTYGSGTWGGGGSLLFSGQLRLYSQDVFGDDLVLNPRGGGIYFWDESVGTTSRAVPLSDVAGASDAPTIALQMMVSPIDKHVIAFGVNPIGSSDIDPMFVRWSDQESVANWTPKIDNSAGGQLLSSGSTIIGATRTRHEIVIFTDTSIHAMRFSGAPFVYQFSPIAENTSCISPNGMVAIGDTVYFMDRDGFFEYRGAVNRIPCTVLKHVLDNIDKDNLFKVFAMSDPKHSEVSWFYPTEGNDISNYVTYNYAERVWTVGTFERAAWYEAKGRSYPIAASADIENPKVNYLYNHEIGYNAEGASIGGYIESGQKELTSQGDGESYMYIDRIVPDFKYTGSTDAVDMGVIIKGANYPQDTPTQRSSSTITDSTGQSDVRVRAREVILRVETNSKDHGWNMGDFRFDMRTDGKR